MYEKTKQYIFSEIGKRVKKKKKEKKLTYYQLAGHKNKKDYKGSLKGQGEDNAVDKQFRYNKFDYSLITNIAGGRAYPKKNPNLVPDLYIEHLSEKLGFTSEKELLWGNFKNENTFQKILFEKLMLDVLWGREEVRKDVFNRILFDYIPYAEYHSYWQMFIACEIDMPKMPDETYTIPAYYYQLESDDIFAQYEIKQKKAIKYTWYKFEDYFLNLINDFLDNSFNIESQSNGNSKEEKSLFTLKKLNRKLDKLVDELKNFFIENEPNEDSLGFRVRDIIISDYKKYGMLISKEMNQEKRELNELVIKYLVESSLRYIVELKRVQVIETEVIKGYNLSTNE
ncbi:hypothetical protein [Enterococcus durans]|uniref:hypothetical protein n=1 Tax=Enterococcus durans TaxID=53345 RepID=UPI001C8C2A89|nr:hypothetical protein [Enterococcus durans]MBX9041516.1 hypothetical protein [Enterococcus durans]MBX9078442.1 hypothetical protein [Enterococcus durans]